MKSTGKHFDDPAGIVIAYDQSKELMAKKPGTVFNNAEKLSKALPPCPPFTASGTWSEFKFTI